MGISQLSCHFFVGPTCHGLELPGDWSDGLCIHPPVRRGDIAQLCKTDRGGVVVIVDGTYHRYPAVAHAEIRTALEQGWEVWGLSSMGAIRAAEMSSLGMKGFGVVYEAFAEDENLPDDVVALVHADEPPYTPVSEPLIHIKAYLKDLIDNGLIDSAQYREVIAKISCTWFGNRTLPALRTLLSRSGVDATQLEESLRRMKHFQRYRVKCHDFKKFLVARPWVAGGK
jgi:hypothetical protein